MSAGDELSSLPLLTDVYHPAVAIPADGRASTRIEDYMSPLARLSMAQQVDRRSQLDEVAERRRQGWRGGPPAVLDQRRKSGAARHGTRLRTTSVL